MSQKVTTKLTVEVDTQQYDRLTSNMHYGQLSQLVRSFVLALDKIVRQGDQDQIFLWLYGKGQLTLPNQMEDKDEGT